MRFHTRTMNARNGRNINYMEQLREARFLGFESQIIDVSERNVISRPHPCHFVGAFYLFHPSAPT
jgi:hypothetical protein